MHVNILKHWKVRNADIIFNVTILLNQLK